MSEPITIRVGICECTNSYHGRLKGRTLRTDRYRFRIKEVVVAEDHQGESIKDSGCHFFIDAHRSYTASELWTSLDLNDIIYDSNGHRRLFIGGVDGKRGMGLRRFWWTTKRPKRPSAILKGIEEILRGIEPAELRRWLSRMATQPSRRRRQTGKRPASTR